MANIRFLSWNIQVLGPKKYGRSVNNQNLLFLVGELIATCKPQVVVLQELMSSVAEQVAFTAAEVCSIATKKTWGYRVIRARPEVDRESYAFLYQTEGVSFAPVANGWGIAAQDFPTKELSKGGRRPAYMYFKTTDTNVVFVASSYHAPPSGRTSEGVMKLGKMPELYSINPGGAGVITATSRVLGGDYNMAWPLNADCYLWLTDPLPVAPPPSVAGEGAGTTPAATTPTILYTVSEAQKAYGDDPSKWNADPDVYLQNQNCLDNLFCRPAAVAGGVVDGLRLIMDTSKGAGRFAAKYQTTDAGSATFPDSDVIPSPLAQSLKKAPYAFIFYRNAVSDHMPVWADVTI